MAANDEDLTTLAAEAYIFLYPLVTMEVTRRQATNVASGVMTGRGPMNSFVHVRSFPTADFRDVVRPNFDTLYSSAWLDLSGGPMVVSSPDLHDRYFMLPMLDMWTDVFAVPGKRTTGTAPAAWAVVPPGWHGELPNDVGRIDAPTPYVWVIGRTQTNGPSDYDAVRAVQDGFALRPLDADAAPPTPPIDPSIDMTTPPLEQVDALSGLDLVARGAQLMRRNPPHVTDWSVVQRLTRLGVRVGEDLDVTSLGDDVLAALHAAPALARDTLASVLPTMATITNGWLMNTNTVGVYGNFYAKRAIIATRGLGANPPEDAVYPLLLADADGEAVDGSREYVLHFDAADLPPVGAFWSLTLYDEQGFQVANEIDRFALGDRDPLHYNADGSLDLYVQRARPAADREANWLPSAPGPLGLTMRLYAPDARVLNGAWSPPPLRRTSN